MSEFDDLLDGLDVSEGPKDSPKETDPYEKTLTELFGEVDDKKFDNHVRSQIRDIEYGTKLVDETEKKYEEDKDIILVFFDIKDPFDESSVLEEKVKFTRPDPSNEDAVKKMNVKIDYAFHNYGIKDWDSLEKIAALPEKQTHEILTKIIDNMSYDKSLVNFYQGHFITKKDNNDPGTTVLFWSVINRSKKFSTRKLSPFYEQWNQEHPDDKKYPTYPDKDMSIACSMLDEHMKCEIVNIENNVNFKRFEVEVHPVEGQSEFLDKHMKENHIYSFLCTYPYGERNGDGIDARRRLTQSDSIARSLGAVSYSACQDKIGTTRFVKISKYESKSPNAVNGYVYRARLE